MCCTATRQAAAAHHAGATYHEVWDDAVHVAALVVQPLATTAHAALPRAQRPARLDHARHHILQLSWPLCLVRHAASRKLLCSKSIRNSGPPAPRNPPHDSPACDAAPEVFDGAWAHVGAQLHDNAACKVAIDGHIPVNAWVLHGCHLESCNGHTRARAGATTCTYMSGAVITASHFVRL
jgi:hypothetical protein